MAVDREWVKQLSLFGIVSSLITGYSLGGVGLGYMLWRYASFPMWVSIVSGMAGLVLGSYRVSQVVKRMNLSKENEKK